MPGEASWFDDLSDKLREIGDDLLSLEVNTIEKENMTARKMPEFPLAMIEIAEGYLDYLAREVRYDLGTWWAACDGRLRQGPVDNAVLEALATQISSASKAAATLPTKPMTLSLETFERLRLAAALERRVMKPPTTDIVLKRIERNCDALIALLKALQRVPRWPEILQAGLARDQVLENTWLMRARIEPHQLTLVRKIWDIGTEKVRLQTLIQLDGDVLTRIAPELTDDRAARLLDVHQKGVRFAVGYWDALFKILFALVGRSPRAPEEI